MKKTFVTHPCPLPVLTISLGLILIGRSAAQTFTNLHNFNDSDGSRLQAGLIISGNTLYGVADSGGDSSSGTVFKMNTDGTGFTNLYHFTGGNDGQYPDGTLALSGNTLYGTAYYGGSAGNGTVFKLNTNGTGFATVHSFAGAPSQGANPETGLIISGNRLYGTTESGGSGDQGVVFAVNTDGTGYTNLHSFTNGIDGSTPESLVLSGATLYGTAIGASSGKGTVFKVNTNGSGFLTLHTFVATNYIATPPGSGPRYTNSDGALPTGLTISGNTLYGTAFYGGSAGNGTVFRMNTNGTAFTNLHSFPVTFGPRLTNSEGTHPIGFSGLVVSGNTLYGTALFGGSSGNGTVFSLHTDGTGFTTLYNFTATNAPNFTNNDGANPYPGLLLSSGTLYGIAKWGGTAGYGTAFGLSLPAVIRPQLAVTRLGTNVILAWTNDGSGFTLQSSTNLSPPATWLPVSPAPVLVNGQNTVTNPISGTERYFRLTQ